MFTYEGEFYYTLGNNLRKLREYNDLSQDMIGELLGVDRSTCSNWERGKTAPKPPQLMKLSKIYNVSIDFILNDHPMDLTVAAPSFNERFGETFLSLLSDEEKMLILKYRLLNNEDKLEIDKKLEEISSSEYYTHEIEK